MDDANEIVALPTGLRRHIVKTIEFRKRKKKKDSGGRKKKTTRLLSGKQRTRMERKEMLRKKEKN